MSHLEITDASFRNEVIESAVPVVVDIWAPWCGPCRALGPIIEELADEYQGRVKVTKMNVDDNPAAAQALRVEAVPTILFFKDGKLVDRAVGLSPKAMLKQRIDRLLG